MAEVAENLVLQPDEEPTKPKVADTELVVHDTGEFAMLFDSARFNQAQRVAKLFANSTMVPAHFRGKPADVFVALHLATRMSLDPFMVMSKAYPIQGRIGLEAQLIIALVNARGPFRGPIQWRFEGEGKTRKCTAYATYDKTGELCEMPVDWAMVEAEGWSKKPGSKWLTMPEMMFRYRSATFLARLYCPEVILGLSTVDEIEDMGIIDVVANPVPDDGNGKKTQTEKLKAEIKAKKAPQSPTTDKKPEVHVTGQDAGPGEAPRGITEAQQAYLSKVPDEIITEAFKAIGQVPLLLKELDYDTADKLHQWCQEQ